jgi:hypothetical protein
MVNGERGTFVILVACRERTLRQGTGMTTEIADFTVVNRVTGSWAERGRFFIVKDARAAGEDWL